ncbi:cyclin-J [Anopheles maculipalpis]|uniref:cyclin-J n=1 Tax=Anopheles maculipalpis TaxID=1496333 RepID=UPI0021594089|nr:cyclin-J [Anopheles maculipalpis]
MDRWNTFRNAVYCTEYDEDILETLKECEANREFVDFGSPLLNHRTATVELIEKVCEEQSFRRGTVHLAVYLLDVIMCNHKIAEQNLNLVALTCLYLACKIEENEPNVPSPAILNGFVANTYTPADFIALEVAILNYFNWHITIPTAATFLDIFSLNCVDQGDYNDMPQTEQTSIEEFAQAIGETSGIILKNALRHLKFTNTKPSLLAAGCVAAARLNVSNLPTWSGRLTLATGYEYSQIQSISLELLFDALPGSQSYVSGISTLKLSAISDAGYLSELYDTDEEDTVCSIGQSFSSSGEDSDTTTSSPLAEGSMNRKRLMDSGTYSSDDGERRAKKRKAVSLDQTINN